VINLLLLFIFLTVEMTRIIIHPIASLTLMIHLSQNRSKETFIYSPSFKSKWRKSDVARWRSQYI